MVYVIQLESRIRTERIILLRLEFSVLVLYFSIYFYLCRFNYSLFFIFFFVRAHWAYLF